MKLSHEGICQCGGKLVASEWKLVDGTRKGRTTCQACGRTELKTQPPIPLNKPLF